jgi:hypothetical protein
MLILSKFFNSEFGQKYKVVSNLKAIKLLLEHYKSPYLKKQCVINLKDLNIKPPNLNNIDQIIDKIDNEINTKAKEYLNI